MRSYTSLDYHKYLSGKAGPSREHYQVPGTDLRREGVRILVEGSHQLRVAPDLVGHDRHAVHEVLRAARTRGLAWQ